jgi:hypothetical protein
MIHNFHKQQCVLPGAILLAVLVLPQTASANAGTPLIWGTGLHMLFGNAVIGAVEGFLLSRVFKAPLKRSTLVMILANYLSAWLGGWLISITTDSIVMEITSVHRWFWFLAVMTYATTLLIEWPFVVWSLRSLRRSGLASFMVQTISYTILFGFYWMISVTTLLRQFEIVPSGSIPLPGSVEVYYIGSEDGNVYRLPLSTGKPELLHELKSGNFQDRLYWRRDETDTHHGDLMAQLDEDGRKARSPEIKKGLSGEAALDQHIGHNTWFSFGRVEPVQSGIRGHWEFHTGFWPDEGLRGRRGIDTGGDKEVRLALATPFVSWPVRNAVLLPGDKVLFQLGGNQICVFDPETNRIELLCRGRGPVVILPAPGR